jgi:hypothetical protein
VNKATQIGVVSLITRPFGRGTDFICSNSTVDADGGTIVIQTFLSETESEETQI